MRSMKKKKKQDIRIELSIPFLPQFWSQVQAFWPEKDFS